MAFSLADSDIDIASPDYSSSIFSDLNVAFFGSIFLDSSLGQAYYGVRPDEHARIELINSRMIQALQQSGSDVVDLSSYANNIAECSRCDVDLANEAGADATLVIQISKISNLILFIDVTVRDVSSGKVIRGGSVDIRGNTDESWLRGLDYLLKYRVLSSNPIHYSLSIL